MATTEASMFHRKREWMVQFDNDMRAHAQRMLDTTCLFAQWDTAEVVIQKITEFKRKIMGNLNIDKEALINVGISNLVAACSVKSEQLVNYAMINAWLLTENDKSISALMLPQFTYKTAKNALWLNIETSFTNLH